MACREGLTRQGYCAVDFEMSEAERAAYTGAAKDVIDLAQADAAIHEALTFDLTAFEGRMNPTRFTVSGAVNSNDNKLWLHAGYLSREKADVCIPERNQPLELRNLWSPLEYMLQSVETAARTAFSELEADQLAEAIFHAEIAKRVVIIRTVKYIGALGLQSGTEPVSGHADQSVATVHSYETHGGWFHAAPYPQHFITDDDTPERREAVRAVRSQLMPIVNDHNTKAAFFLGVGATNLPEHLGRPLKGLPGCYHAGFKPVDEAEIISPFADDISRTDRVSTIAFMHPNVDILRSGSYSLATVSQCRPRYETVHN